MSDLGNEEPRQQAAEEPSNGNRNASGPFWDLKASHWSQGILTFALVGIGVAQFCVYNRQAEIMQIEQRPWVRPPANYHHNYRNTKNFQIHACGQKWRENPNFWPLRRRCFG
jgi:hypothetical protein